MKEIIYKIMWKKLMFTTILIAFFLLPLAKASLLDNLLSPFQFLIEIIFPSSPEILEAKIEPIKVEPSDYMVITATVKDKYGIESVKADMAGIELINLTLISGDNKEGTYQANWFVHSVEVGKTYNTTIIARNVKGKESFLVLQFHDDPVFCCRKQINGTGPSNVMSITLDTASLISAGKMRSDCGDIRFTDSKAFDAAFWTRNFSYNLVSGCNSASTYFSVEVPSEVTSFYAYYGNPSVTSISNASVLGFAYRKPITINNTLNSNTLTDYQVLVTLDTASLISAGKMRSDCGDIRFTDSDGITLLNYWLESGCNTGNTKIWVKVPSIPASSTKTIYVYYGNPSATSASNGKNTMIFFDDFSQLDTATWASDVWSETNTNHIVDINPTGHLRTYIKTGCYGTGCYGVTLASSRLIAQFDFSNTILIDYNWYWSSQGTPSYQHQSGNGLLLSTSIDIDQVGGLWTGTSDWIGFFWDPYSNGARKYGFYRRIAGNTTTFAESTGWGSDIVRPFRWIINSTHVIFYTNRASSPFYSGTHGLTDNTGWFFVQMADASGYWQSQHTDYLLIRKYTSPEPTTSIGAEEATATLGPEETWIRIAGGTGNILITGGGGTLKIK